VLKYIAGKTTGPFFHTRVIKAFTLHQLGQELGAETVGLGTFRIEAFKHELPFVDQPHVAIYNLRQQDF